MNSFQAGVFALLIVFLFCMPQAFVILGHNILGALGLV